MASSNEPKGLFKNFTKGVTDMWANLQTKETQEEIKERKEVLKKEVEESDAVDLSATIPPSKWTVSDLVERAAAGTMLHGINWTTDTLSQSRAAVIQSPQSVTRLAPTMDTGSQVKDFKSQTDRDSFEENVKCAGYSAAVHAEASGYGVTARASASVSKSDSKEQKSATQARVVYLSHMHSAIIPMAAVKLNISSLDFTPAAIKYLKTLEQQAGKGTKLEVIRNNITDFFKQFGTHVNTGTVHLGGIYHFHTTFNSKTTKHTTQISSMLADKVSVSLEAGGGAYGVEMKAGVEAKTEQKEGKTAKTSDSDTTEAITLITRYVGGSPGASNHDEWKKSLVSEESKSLWNIIDRGDPNNGLSGVWDIIKNHTNDFKHPRALALLLKLEWHRQRKDALGVKIGDPDSLSELLTLMTSGFVANIKQNLAEDKQILATQRAKQLQEHVNWFIHEVPNIRLILADWINLREQLNTLVDKFSDNIEINDIIATITNTINEDNVRKTNAELQEEVTQLQVQATKLKAQVRQQESELCLQKSEMTPMSIHLIKSSLWCCHSGGISILYLQLGTTRTIGGDPCYGVTDVGDAVVAATSKGIYVLKYSGEVTKEIEKGHFTGVAYCNGKVYAARKDDCLIHKYRTADWTSGGQMLL